MRRIWNQVTAELEEAAAKHEYHTLYRTLKRFSGKAKATNNNIKKSDGTFVKSPEERLHHWWEFFQELYNHDPPAGPSAAPPDIQQPACPMVVLEPTLMEVKNAVRALKNGKAPRIDCIAAEAIKAGGEVLTNQLHLLIMMIWRLEQIPSAWKKAIISLILKKGDSQDCKNYHGISLLSIVGKVFMKIIQSRLQKHWEQSSREEQASFRPGRRCTNQVFSLQQLMEERICCRRQTVLVFIDFKSAFDCIDWPALWKALEAEHIPGKIILLLKEAYNGSTSQVRIRNELSEEFTIKMGV